MGFFDKIKEGLAKTKKALANTLDAIFIGGELDDDFYEELTDCLILADLGVATATKAVERLRMVAREKRLQTTEEGREQLKQILAEMLDLGDTELQLKTKPSVVLVIGVNGVGKTTTIGKIATRMVKEGKKVLLVAGDTFRAAAADQLEIWAERSGASIVRQHEGADPASVVYDGIQSAKAKDVDVILIDTAGRLHNKQNLMNELNKISRVVNRELPDAAKEVLLVLDGTAKGGIVIAVSDALKVPVKFVGVGEQAEDLMPFVAKDFVDALIED
ncbi:MAG: signal recognition particle-docking protein FtsY [Oscillospiraceae bacterium]|nr:signal recognition particle-docking protein FtsY [Oscillospiraceae bacterium]